MADKNKKKKTGLHKEISSIFEGVPVPNDQGIARPHGGPGGPEPGQTGYSSPRPPARSPQNPQIPGSYQQFAQPPGKSVGPGRAKGSAAGKSLDLGALRQMTRKLFAPKPGVSAGRQKLMVILVPILFVILIVMFSKMLRTPSAKTTWSAKPKPATTVSQADTEIDWQTPEPYPTALRDPMQLTAEMTAEIEAQAQAKAEALAKGPTDTGPTEPETSRVGELTVKGILHSEDNPTAVVGTRIAHVGDTIAGATIVKITKTTVEFEKDGERWTQTVEP